jgi:aspartate aminotransferase
VNDLLRKGKDIISLLHRPAGFPYAEEHPGRRDQGHRDGKHGYTPSAGIVELREAAAIYLSRSRGIEVEPEDVVVAAGAKPFIVRDPRHHRLRCWATR